MIPGTASLYVPPCGNLVNPVKSVTTRLLCLAEDQWDEHMSGTANSFNLFVAQLIILLQIGLGTMSAEQRKYL